MALAAKPKDEAKAAQLLPWDSRSPLSVAAAILYAGICIKSKVCPCRLRPCTYLCIPAATRDGMEGGGPP